MYPRESYRLITKAGKYGEQVAHHVYDPEVIRKSVDRSLKRLGTSYLDVVCEFWPPLPCGSENIRLSAGT